MALIPHVFSLTLLGAFLSNIPATLAAQGSHHRYLGHWHIAVRDQAPTPTTTVSPCTSRNCVTATPYVPCASSNGTELIGSNDTRWTMLCDVDFFAQDIYPFFLSGSFEACLQHCEQHNTAKGDSSCAGFVFAPERSNLDNDCYLKSSLHNMVYPATIHLIGAALQTNLPSSTSILPVEPSLSNYSSLPSSVEVSPNDSESRSPTVGNSVLLGTSIDNPTRQYVSHAPAKPHKLASVDIEPGIDIDLITKYPLATDTGSWIGSSFLFSPELSNLSLTPRISRDGGRGGIVNGSHVFVFCDTSTYGNKKDSKFGYMNSFVSSSVAIDHDMNGLRGTALELTDPVGQWQDDVGRMRGWIPMTIGEQAFNYAISGKGYRYAVWPESSPIPLNATHAILFAPLVYLDVDMETQSRPNFTSLGNTLVLISIDQEYGPHADRLVNQFFTQDEVGWGSIGGIRAWSSAGQNNPDGEIYLFGQVDQGVVVSRVVAHDFADRSKYTYWDGSNWTSQMLPRASYPNAMMVDQPVMDMDVFYSPYHKTFIMIYLTPDADNTFYFRFLRGNDGSNLNITAAYEENGDNNYVEKLVMNKWSEPNLLFRVPPPERGYIYAGGLHAGYFGAEDITEGGTKMLCTWTEHTKVDPNKPESGYAHKAQVIDLAW